jgi:hypothetical protein
MSPRKTGIDGSLKSFLPLPFAVLTLEEPLIQEELSDNAKCPIEIPRACCRQTERE